MAQVPLINRDHVPRDPLLVEREKTHGSFLENAETWKDIHDAISKHLYASLDTRQKLALDMIVLKIARMLQQPLQPEHWQDISGYAKLGEEACYSK